MVLFLDLEGGRGGGGGGEGRLGGGGDLYNLLVIISIINHSNYIIFYRICSSLEYINRIITSLKYKIKMMLLLLMIIIIIIINYH